MKLRIKGLLCVLFCVLSVQGYASSSPYENYFSHRYPFLKDSRIEIQKLHDTLREVLLVDVRSPYEFEALHIKRAVNYSIDDSGFLDMVRNLRRSSPKAIIFYCNGPGCERSQRAMEIAKENDIFGVASFDAGMFYWAAMYPDYTVSFNRLSPDISSMMAVTAYTNHLMPRKEFAKKLANKSALVLDIRGSSEREGKGIFAGSRERWVNPVDDKALNSVIDKAVSEDRPLYIYDNIGDRTRLLPYRLKQRGASKYYFLASGAMGKP